MKTKYSHDFLGEMFGTFILVFFGCGSVAVTVLFSAHVGLFQIAAVWGVGVTLAIYATRHLSCAHLNPAVSAAMVAGKRMSLKKLPVYIVAQFSGAFLAVSVLYIIYAGSIAQYEILHGIVRGTPESVRTAMIFGEFYPNPSAEPAASVSMINAFLAEFIGTFVLVSLIFALTEGCNVGRPDGSVSPFFIGLTVTALISIIAPLTQAGLNPARDLAPRMFAYLAGWKNAALPDNRYGFLIVYVLGPLAGGILASIVFTYVIEPIMKNKSNETNCNCS
ncbi:MAG: aquaporin [Nitrospirae bacterium]|nr:aquaporin [Nitrospirota bacterium]